MMKVEIRGKQRRRRGWALSPTERQNRRDRTPIRHSQRTFIGMNTLMTVEDMCNGRGRRLVSNGERGEPPSQMGVDGTAENKEDAGRCCP